MLQDYFKKICMLNMENERLTDKSSKQELEITELYRDINHLKFKNDKYEKSSEFRDKNTCVLKIAELESNILSLQSCEIDLRRSQKDNDDLRNMLETLENDR